MTVGAEAPAAVRRLHDARGAVAKRRLDPALPHAGRLHDVAIGVDDRDRWRHVGGVYYVGHGTDAGLAPCGTVNNCSMKFRRLSVVLVALIATSVLVVDPTSLAAEAPTARALARLGRTTSRS